jgi:hypothetical protein
MERFNFKKPKEKVKRSMALRFQIGMQFRMIEVDINSVCKTIRI